MPVIEGELRAFIVETFLLGRPGLRFRDDESFLDKGIIDSAGVVELVVFLERRYGINVEDEDLVPENLDSIARLAAFVSRKTPARCE